jgi:hypothetical protein
MPNPRRETLFATGEPAPTRMTPSAACVDVRAATS